MAELDPRIRIRAPLRCDGIGRLDCAEDAESGVRLAVRWLPLEANGESAAQACEKLPQHPTLPKIRQTGKVGAFSYVAMDFPEGELLAAREGDVLPFSMLQWMTAQIADALATIHSQGVFHGEMSAESILVVKPEKAEKAYLWDMPLVIANRLTDRRGEERLMHQLVRTAAYLAPERARGEKPTAACDVYALGAIACIAAGAPKPVAHTTLGVVHQVATGAFRPEVPRALPESMRSLLARMLSVDPKLRPQASEVVEVFSPDAGPSSSTPTLREMPALVWPPVPELGALPPTGPRPSLPPLKGPSSWTAMPAVTSAPAAAVFAPSLAKPLPPPPGVKAGPTLVAPPVLKPSSAAPVLFRPVAISPESPVVQVASDAAPTPPAPPRVSVPEMMMVPEPTGPAVALPKSVMPAASMPEPTAPVQSPPVQTAPVPATPVQTAPVQSAAPQPALPSPPKPRPPVPPQVDERLTRATGPAIPVKPAVAALEHEVPEASPDDVADVTAPALNVAKAAAMEQADGASVALTESVSVSPELVEQGAKALSPAEARALMQRKLLPWLVGGAATVLLGVLGAVAIGLASQPRVQVVQAPRAAPVKAAQVVKVAAPESEPELANDEDLLAAPTRVKRARRSLVRQADSAPAPKAEPKSDSDFSLSDDADAPLKRPAF